jgi:hypothetical protein
MEASSTDGGITETAMKMTIAGKLAIISDFVGKPFSSRQMRWSQL